MGACGHPLLHPVGLPAWRALASRGDSCGEGLVTKSCPQGFHGTCVHFACFSDGPRHTWAPCEAQLGAPRGRGARDVARENTAYRGSAPCMLTAWRHDTVSETSEYMRRTALTSPESLHAVTTRAGGRSSPEAPCPAPLRAPRPAQPPSRALRAGRASTEPSGAMRRIRVLVPCGSCTCLTSRSVSARRQQWSCRERRLHLYYFWEIGSALRIRVGSLQKGPRALPGGPSCGLGRLQQCPRSEGRGLGPPEPGDSQRGAAAVGAHTTRGALDAVGSGCWLPPGTQPEAPGGLSLRGSHPFLKWKR